MSNKKILVLDTGDAPYPLVVARSLGSAGYDVHLGFSCDSYIFDAFSKYCRGIVFYPNPSYAREDFLSFFEKLAGKYDFIIPAMEKTQLPISMIKDMLEEKGTLVPIPPYDVLKNAVNKVKMLEICSQNGINIPKTLILTDVPTIDDVVEKVGIPFIMKTSTEINIPPGPQHRYFVFKKKPTQELFLVAFKKLQKYGPVILQEWVEGTGIGASFIFSKYHKVVAYFGHRRILERFPDGGPSVIAESYLYPDALKNGAKLLKALKWQGVAMTEFRLKHDGKLYFMELNPRFWGTLPLAIASGVDFPRLLIEYYNSTQENNFYGIQKKKVFVKSLAICHLLLESVRTKNFAFLRKIMSSTPKIFKHGFPFIEEFEKCDLTPLIKRVIHGFRGRFSRKNISGLDGILFGPALPYEKLIRLGVKSIIDLREDHEKGKVIVPSGINYYSFPIKDDSSPKPMSFHTLVSLIDKCLQEGKVYIHCRLGRGRTPMAIIAYLISKGLSLETSYQIVYNIRPYTYLNLTQKRGLYNFYKKYCIRWNEET
uniref:ATP-grasp domain-containing protein n=1 Tax=candidate division CPR3 bacterium TaxID=2268181 RepID=A0A7C5URB1_UNCC3